ncbi:Hypothetical predicted protein [Paramuricea clavata]|uniref:Uncharacterized protein n=1 Tax=Paramuricea clavata TaxID=317549 RepID=A0A7D9LQ66_PARCT|nr:Hypothetical predicted protein [Paramuricea clavata]
MNQTYKILRVRTLRDGGVNPKRWLSGMKEKNSDLSSQIKIDKFSNFPQREQANIINTAFLKPIEEYRLVVPPPCRDLEESTEVLVLELYHDIMLRYLRMGVGQFLRDFRKDYKLKKSLAHRKAVLQKKEKANVKKMKVHMPQIEQDKNRNKQLSHLQLRALVGNIKALGMRAMYNFVMHTMYGSCQDGTKSN